MSNKISYDVLIKKVDYIAEQVGQIKKALMELRPRRKERIKETWNDLMELSDEISEKWQGMEVVQEIRAQRNKDSKDESNS